MSLSNRRAAFVSGCSRAARSSARKASPRAMRSTNASCAPLFDLMRRATPRAAACRRFWSANRNRKLSFCAKSLENCVSR
eukprot:2919005-Prymnesium_polylepis.1